MQAIFVCPGACTRGRFQQFNVPVYKPANGEMIHLERPLQVYADVSPQLIEQTLGPQVTGVPAKRLYPLNAYVVMREDTKRLELITPKEAAHELGVRLHSITFSALYRVVSKLDWRALADRLRRYDPELQEKQVRRRLKVHQRTYSPSGRHRSVRQRADARGGRQQRRTSGNHLGRGARIVARSHAKRAWHSRRSVDGLYINFSISTVHSLKQVVYLGAKNDAHVFNSCYSRSCSTLFWSLCRPRRRRLWTRWSCRR